MGANEVKYFDASSGTLSVEFDGSDETALFSGAYTRSREQVQLGGGKTRRNAKFALNGANFRREVEAPEFAAGGGESVALIPKPSWAVSAICRKNLAQRFRF